MLVKRIPRQVRVQLWRGVTGLLTLGLALLLHHQGLLTSFERWTYDVTLRLGLVKTSQDIVIVAIDEKSLRQLGQWPWPRGVHGQLTQYLTQAEADTIVFDILFSEPSADPQQDSLFAKAMEKHGRVILPIHFEATEVHGLPLEKPPTQQLYQSAYAIGHVDLLLDEDGISRAAADYAGVSDAFWPHLPLLFDAENPDASENTDQGVSQKIERRQIRQLLFARPGEISLTYSYVDVLEGTVAKHTFRNKIVLIGATATGLGDTVSTPVGMMPGVEFLANQFVNIKSKLHIHPIKPPQFLLINSVIVLLLLFWLSRLSPGWFLVNSLLFALSACAISTVLLLSSGIWFPSSILLLSLVLFYPLWSWQRLAIAIRYLERQLHDLQQKEQTPEVHLETALQNILPLVPELRWHFSLKPTTNLNSKWSRQVYFPLSRRYLLLQNIPEQWLGVIDDLLHTHIDPDLPSNHGVEVVEHLIGHLRRFQQRGQRQQTAVQSALNNVSQRLWIADCSGMIFFQDHAQDSDKGLWLQLAEFPSKEDSLQEKISALLLQGTPIEYECHIHKEIFWIQVKKLDLEPLNYPLIVANAANITASKANEKLREDTLRFLSHDIRSPLVSILAIIERIRKNKDQTMAQADWLSIEKYARKNLQFSQNFLQLLQAQATRKTDLYPCDAENCLEGAYTQMLPVAQANEIQLNYQPSSSITWVQGDTDLLERCIVNLLSNAIKFSSPGQQVFLRSENQGNILIIEVEDTAGGLPPEIEQRLFERFHKTKENNPNGTGLGLAFVQTVMQKLGGSIAVHNDFGHGLRITLSIQVFENWET